MPTGTRPAASTYTVGHDEEGAAGAPAPDLEQEDRPDREQLAQRRRHQRPEEHAHGEDRGEEPEGTAAQSLPLPDDDEAEEEPGGGEIEKPVEEARDAHERLMPNELHALPQPVPGCWRRGARAPPGSGPA